MLRAMLLVLVITPPLVAQYPTREQKVRDDKKKVEAAGYWIYNDYATAIVEAKKTNKPLVVVLRCIPCEECVKLDDDLVNSDPVLRPLLDQFVRVRIVGTNGLDLSLFQFDTDQSFAVFLLNPDGTIYGRFGTRSHRTNWVGDVSLKGLAKALQGALKLHAEYATVKPTLAAKRGPAPEVPTPEKFPSFQNKFTSRLDYAGTNVVKSCIHCHQISDARLEYHREKNGTIPEEILFPFPHPKSIGLILDPNECATVKDITPDSPAAKAGFQVGDVIRTMAGQPLLSIADVQWVLHGIPTAGGMLDAKVIRNDKPIAVHLVLDAGWRRAGDISWRASTWGLRRMATGGILFEEVDGKLLAKHVGEYGAHAAAKNAGVKKGDVLVSFDGKEFSRESDLLNHALTKRKIGDKVPVVFERAGKTVSVSLPIQP